MAMGAPWGMITGQNWATPRFLPMDDAGAVDRLLLAQWLQPSFPIGGFAYSQGLEQAIVAGDVAHVTDVRQWISDVLLQGSGRMDAVFLAQARSGVMPIADLAELALAYAASAERALEMTEQGRAFGQVIGAITGMPQPDLPYALAVGYATRGLRMDTADVVQLWLHGLANQIAQAAVRFLPMGQTDAQIILAGLARPIVELANWATQAPLSALASSTFGADLAQMQHETLTTRIFRT